MAAKNPLHDLLLENNLCADCGNPNPLWASVSFAVFLCLQCAGLHRAFGVHISFVRSVSMDTWQQDQLRRMHLGGNASFKQFMRSYTPADKGGYSDGMDTHALYHCWAATQYREKLDHALVGTPWSPSTPPPLLTTTPLPPRPSSAQALRKSRASARSPPPSNPPASTTTPDTSHVVKKSANESFFASLGQANALRPTDLPPSQGGRYQGFGNTPSPSQSQHPSFALTSAVTPSLADFQDNPAAALSKGWSLFSAAVAGASRVVNETVVQPGIVRVMDPNLHTSVRDYVSEAHRRAQQAGHSVNDWSKIQLGVDVADHVNGIVGSVKDKFGPGPSPSGYASLALHDEGESSPSYDDTNDFFHEYSDMSPSSSATLTSHSPGVAKAKKGDDWDEWQDF